ncbi:hypothetical protein WG907_09045 [Sphingobium sp. AN558]|uniref:hypothetical protein n=1 Tax=Sphingobium sp. AN558 TaxID=3133442 RepID=UPI0030C08804
MPFAKARERMDWRSDPMVMRFWLASGGVMMAGLMAGMGLGSYATHIPAASPVPFEGEADDMGASTIGHDDSGPSAIALRGPSEISCKGCGPTLSDRRMAADMAELPVPRYLADEDYRQQFDDLPTPVYEAAQTIAAPAPSPAPATDGTVAMIEPAQDAPAP